MSILLQARKGRVATCSGFIALGGLTYIWSTNVSAVRAQVGLFGAKGDMDFGLMALASGAAAALGSFMAGEIADRYGCRRAIIVSSITFALVVIALGQVSSAWYAAPLFALFGLCRGACDTALNAHGIQVERLYGRSIMTSFHFCFSFGGFIIGLFGSWLASIFIDNAQVQFSLIGGIMLVINVLTCFWLLPNTTTREHHETIEKQSVEYETSAETPLLIGLMIAFGVLLLGGMVSENVVGDWGEEFVRRVNRATGSQAGTAVSVFIGAEAAGRLFGDRLAQFFGRSRVVLVSAVSALIGIIMTVFPGTPTSSIIGFATLGLGLANVAPLMLSSAGRADPDSSGRNIGIVNAIGYSANLVSPAMTTLVVTSVGLGKLMYFPFIMLIPLLLFGPALMRRSEHFHHREMALD
ncbi:MFS transporter [Acetobacter persici]|uniref:MFS transporter n=1 Tax=Acetobacter persici TaxID=1076596 RepID=UPI001F23973A|nr:MFS transporter [Acetobacter persici]MCG0999487.1 MFS transporter [Acetobacter persici]